MLTISNICTKHITEDDDDVKIAIKLDVENNSEDEQIYVDLQGIDADGFELDSTILSAKVPVGSKKTITTQLYINKSQYKDIVSWQVK